MYCVSCGTQLPDEANFCLKCGKPQKPDVRADEPQWELCEITLEVVTSGFFADIKYKYVAKAVGPNGIYMVGETPLIKQNANKQQEKAVDTLVTQLTRTNWEATGKGEGQYNYKFRRRVKQP